MEYAKFNEHKALAAILHVTHELQKKAPEGSADLYALLKIVYFADRKHLARYNRTIFGDFYVAMSHGPVPSRAYDMLKFVRGDGCFQVTSSDFALTLRSAIQVYDRVNLVPLGRADLEELSESDIECLNEAIRENQDLSFGALKNKSHDLAWHNADEEDRMSLEIMAESEGATNEMIGYVRNWLENENFSTK